MNEQDRATGIRFIRSIIAVLTVLSTSLFVTGTIRAAELADPSAPRTLVVAVEVDREGGRLIAFTSKERAFAPQTFAESDLAQIEVVLLGPGGARHTQQITVAGLCLDHGPDVAPEIQGDTIRLHRESFLVEEPELEGFDQIELAYYTGDAFAPTRKVLGVANLDASHFTSAGTAARFEELAIARPSQAPASSGFLTPGTVHFPEEYTDPDIIKVYGSTAETTRRINVVIVPDGYTYAQKATMEAHAQAMVDAFRAKSPYKEHDRFLNYILVYAYSTEDGTDQCDCSIVRDTAMNTRFPLITASCGHNDNRCLFYGSGNGGPNCDPNVSSANIATTELRAPARDTTIVMVNTARYGGCGGARAVYSAANAAATDVAIHELGHSLGNLADEYGGTPSCGVSAGGINTSTDPINGGWPEWIADLGAPRQGAQYYDQCVYRPIANCEMRTLGPEFCPVCKQQWALKYFGHPRVNPTAPLESQHPVSPLDTGIGTSVAFAVSTRLASGPGITNDFTWTLHGPGFPVPTTVATGTEAHTRSFALPGTYTLTCQIIADTNLVKPVKNGANVDTASWTVNVYDIGESCGNGTLEPGETCDDGNATGGDCCSATCSLEPTGTACSDGNACTAIDLCARAPFAYVDENFDGATAPLLPAEWITAVTPSTEESWTTTTTFSGSPPISVTASTPTIRTDKTLDRDAFVALPGSVLEFDNRFNMDTGFDGAVLEIKIGAGAFTDILTAGGSFVTGGYNATISAARSSPIAGRAAWSGASAGFVHTTVNLPAVAAGQTVILRFRVASDLFGAAAAPNGQWIDDVQISIDASSCQPGDPVTAPTGAPVATVVESGENTFDLSWSALPGATEYDIVYGDLGSLRGTGGDFQLATSTCLNNDVPGLTVDLFGDPAVGEGLWYLVRGANCGGNGTYDDGQPSQINPRDPAIAASGSDCP